MERKEFTLKTVRVLLTTFYLLFAFNFLCEIGCNTDCDPREDLYSFQVEECKHPSCELSHTDQHNYVKNDSSESSSKKLSKLTPLNFLKFEFDYDLIETLHAQVSIQALNNHSTNHFLQNRKRTIVYERLKILHS